MIHYIIVVLVLSSSWLYSQNFQTLKELQELATRLEEFPESDNQFDWNSPDYTSYYKRITPSLFSRLLNFLEIKKLPWTIEGLKNQLEQLTALRESLNFNSRHVLHIRCKADTRFLVWSDIHGAFHSLVRGLTFLQKREILNEKLVLTKKDYYLVFNGNCIDRGPYSLEVLSLIAHLMEKNPQQVIYLRGKHEDKNYWYNFNLKTALQIRASHIDHSLLPLGNLLSRFFDTLPLALYISSDSPPTKLIRISPTGFEETEIKEQELGELFLDEVDTNITMFDLAKPKKIISPVEVKMLVKTANWMQEQRVSQGLGLLDQQLGATTWAVFSSPTSVHRKYYDFHFDAFVEIVIDQPITSSLISLFHQNVQHMEGITLYNTYSMYSGQPHEPNDPRPDFKSDIRFGSSMALIGGVASMGTRVARGMAAQVNEVNQLGGINAHTLRTFVLNDDYTPAFARQNVTYLLKDFKIDTFLLPVGSPTLNVYFDYIKANKVLVLFPITGGPQFRKSDLKGLIHFRASYADEVRDLINYSLTELGAQKFAFFYQDDAYGHGPLEAAHKALKEKGITEWIDIPYTRATANLKEQAQKIEIAQPDVIGLFSAGNPTQELFRQMGLEALANKKLFGISFLAEESFRNFIEQNNIKVILGAVVPNPHLSQLEIVKEYRHAMDLIKQPYDVFSLEAYIATSIICEMIKEIKGEINKESMAEKLQSLKNYPFKGLTLTFNAEHRDLSQPVWIETGKENEWIEGKPTVK